METEQIRAVNDKIRANLPMVTPPHKVVISSGLMGLEDEELNSVLMKVRVFDSFDESVDPHNEHDFGMFYHNDEKIYFKFDYYDTALEAHGYDRHVLTIMTADEY